MFDGINFLQSNAVDTLDDRVYKTDGHFDEDNYYIVDEPWYEKKNEGKDFTYKINSNGFRSQHFVKLDKENTNILFSGCSWTFGEGLPIEYTWADILSKKIAAFEKNVEYFNVGFMGASIDLIIKNVFSFIVKYGSPNYIFICFPDMSRKVIYDKEELKYIKTFAHPHFIKNKVSDASYKYNTSYDEENNFYYNTLLIHMLEQICQDLNIKLIFTTWFWPELELYKKINFKNFYYLNLSNLYGKDVEHENPYFGIARDGMHPGYLWNATISNKFFNRLKDDNSWN